MADRIVHCWKDKREWLEEEGLPVGFDEPGATCMLKDGHAGPHEWTPDEEIRIEFK